LRAFNLYKIKIFEKKKNIFYTHNIIANKQSEWAYIFAYTGMCPYIIYILYTKSLSSSYFALCATCRKSDEH